MHQQQAWQLYGQCATLLFLAENLDQVRLVAEFQHDLAAYESLDFEERQETLNRLRVSIVDKRYPSGSP